jgi:hypothetical protein
MRQRRLFEDSSGRGAASVSEKLSEKRFATTSFCGSPGSLTVSPSGALVSTHLTKRLPAVRPKGAATCQPRAKRNGVSREASPWVGNPINVRSPERAKPIGERGSVYGCARSGLKTSFVTVTWGGAALCPRLLYCCPFRGEHQMCRYQCKLRGDFSGCL